ncbi:uncharacterized protein P884DRAFT_272599 [Thermothelomyces heterothallicus CBS 202.75]|uniref:uncharacterized protein n=1 Tax=Thermothelomyces heterothallicus CBS 202.75 TaxID=1149848 RepID=UPI00374457F3
MPLTHDASIISTFGQSSINWANKQHIAAWPCLISVSLSTSPETSGHPNKYSPEFSTDGALHRNLSAPSTLSQGVHRRCRTENTEADGLVRNTGIASFYITDLDNDTLSAPMAFGLAQTRLPTRSLRYSSDNTGTDADIDSLNQKIDDTWQLTSCRV